MSELVLMSYHIDLSFHQIDVRVSAYLKSVVENTKHEFQYFQQTVSSHEAIQINVLPIRERQGEWISILRTPRSDICLSSLHERKVIFFGKAWVHYQPSRKRTQIYVDEEEVAFEAVYLALLSHVGEKLDAQGMHRIHGFGFELGEKGGVVMASSGTGKSVLALTALKFKGVKILSDDTPVATRNRRMIAFPQRIALKHKPAVPGKYLRKFVRHGYGCKHVISSKYFSDQTSKETSFDYLILMERHKKNKGTIRHQSRAVAVFPLFKWLVLGYETPQIWELYIRFSLRDFYRQISALLSRLRVAHSILRHCQVYRLYMGEDSKKNWNLVSEVVRAR